VQEDRGDYLAERSIAWLRALGALPSSAQPA